MQTAISQFRANMARVRNLGYIAHTLEIQTTHALDSSDILRSQIVLAVSALDLLVHEVVRLGMLDAYSGERPRTPQFLAFQVSLASLLNRGDSEDEQWKWLDDQIKSRHGHRAFQRPNRIAEAIRLISDIELWNQVSDILGFPTKQIRTTLGSIVDRRNQIVHEVDVIPSADGELWPIDAAMANEMIDFIESVAEAIFEIVVQ